MTFLHSESLAKIAPAILAAQKKLKNPTKNAKGNYGKFADLGAVLDAAKAAFNGEGVSIIQTPAPAAYGTVGLTTILLHASGEYVGGTTYLPIDRVNAQGAGSALTYTRRYGINAITGMFADDDDDGQAASNTVATQKASPPLRRSIFKGR